MARTLPADRQRVAHFSAQRSPAIADQVAQDFAVQTQDRVRTSDVGDRVVHVGDALPAVLKPVDMLRVFQVSRATFYKRLALGWYDTFELTPRRGAPVWSGAKVQRFLNGERVGFVFGRKRA